MVLWNRAGGNGGSDICPAENHDFLSDSILEAVHKVKLYCPSRNSDIWVARDLAVGPPDWY